MPTTTANRSGSTSGLPADSHSCPPSNLPIRWTYDMRRMSSRPMWLSTGSLR
ncbi:Uncharacterised protein [Mycobacterium tuberculosis]|nr:Uncharacterised protein [Mycobacterium tuberculosis]